MILAGARSHRIDPNAAASIAAFLVRRNVRRGGVGCDVWKTTFDLFQNRREVLGLWPHVPGMVPLKVRLNAAVDPPICVAQVIIQYRVRRLQVDRLFQRLSRFGILSQLEMSPP